MVGMSKSREENQSFRRMFHSLVYQQMIPNVGNLSSPSPTGEGGRNFVARQRADMERLLYRASAARRNPDLCCKLYDRVQLHAIPLFGLLDVRM